MAVAAVLAGSAMAGILAGVVVFYVVLSLSDEHEVSW